MTIFYLCDRQRCDKCSWPMCRHTKDIKYARNFKQEVEDIYVEAVMDRFGPGCIGCKYSELEPNEYPCNECKRNYYDNYEEADDVTGRN